MHAWSHTENVYLHSISLRGLRAVKFYLLLLTYSSREITELGKVFACSHWIVGHLIFKRSLLGSKDMPRESSASLGMTARDNHGWVTSASHFWISILSPANCNYGLSLVFKPPAPPLSQQIPAEGFMRTREKIWYLGKKRKKKKPLWERNVYWTSCRSFEECVSSFWFLGLLIL